MYLKKCFNFYFVGAVKQKKTTRNQNCKSEAQGWSPYIFEAISYNGLAYFLLANLLTGAVNFSIQTMHVATWSAVLIISAYIFVLHIFTYVLYEKKFRMKIW